MDNDSGLRKRFEQAVREYEQELDREANSVDRVDGEKYGTDNKQAKFPRKVKRAYDRRSCDNGFMETPQFWDNLIEIGNKIGRISAYERDERLSEALMEVNEKLPANVYIPFFKDHIRLYNVLCVWKGRLFSTKERAPYSVWV